MGNLGNPKAIETLRDVVTPILGDAIIAPAVFADSYSVRQLQLAIATIIAMAKLGDQSLVSAVVHLATLVDPKDGDSGSDLRVAAVTALSYIAAPGVAAALRQALSDPNDEVVEEAMRSSLYLGRTNEAHGIMDIARLGGMKGELAIWYLEAWSGQHPTGNRARRPTKTSLDKWWATIGSAFSAGVCYRSGRPIDLGHLSAKIADDPLHLRDELRIHTGAACFQDGLRGEGVSKPELSCVTAWRKAHAAEYPAGKLHRWGRTYDPGAVD